MPLIDRGALMEELRDMLCSETMSKHLSQDDCFSVRVGIKKAMQMVGNAPTIDPVRRGRWVMDTDPDDGDCRCSNCHRCIDALHRRNHARLAALGYKPNTFYRFCPSCGCKMGGEANA